MLSEHIWKVCIEKEESGDTLHDWIYDLHNHGKHIRNQSNGGKEEMISHLWASENIRWCCSADNESLSLLCFSFIQIACSILLQILFWELLSQSVDSSFFLHTSPFSSFHPSRSSLAIIKHHFNNILASILKSSCPSCVYARVCVYFVLFSSPI